MKKPIKIQFHHIIWAVFYAFLFALILNHSFLYLDPDLGWHLKSGQETAQTGSVPHINTINYTLNGERWVDHEWLANLGMHYVYTHWGYIVLSLIFAAIALLIFILLHRWIKKEFVTQPNPWLLMLLELVGLLTIIPHLGIRVQEITALSLLLLFLILYYYGKNKKIWTLFWLLPLFYLWANLHGGFIIGPVILFLFLWAKLLEGLLKRFRPFSWIDFSQALTVKQLGLVFIFSILATATTLLTPYKLELFSFLGSYGNTFYLNHIMEWLPQWSFPYVYWQFGFIATLLVLLVLWLIYVIKGRRGWKINIWQTGIIIALMIMAIKSRRHFPLLFIASFPWLFWFLTEFLDIKSGYFQLKQKLTKYLLPTFIIIVLVLSTANTLLATNFHSQPFQSFCEDKYNPEDGGLRYPCAALKFIKQWKDYDNYRLLNNFGWGGFFIWTWQEKQLFIDGRLPQAPYQGRSLLEEYWDFQVEATIPAALEKHQIEMVFIGDSQNKVKLNWLEKNFMLLNEAELNNTRNYLREYLEQSPEWKRIYNDAISIIYVKK